ncbi:MAG: O-antigen ligase family protein [Pseudomonadota bacterium]
MAPIVIAALLAAGLVLGGAGQDVEVRHGALQLLALGALAWAVFRRPRESMLREARFGFALAAAFAVAATAQLVPLPPELWTALPGRAPATESFKLLDQPAPWAPLSMTPDETLAGVLHVIPALAVFAVIVRSDRRATNAVALAVPSLAIVSAVWGGAQLAGGRESIAYLYDPASVGYPAGAFANVNHQGTLLLAALPFLAALAHPARVDAPIRFGQGPALAALYTALVLALIATRSLFAYVMIVPVVAACLAISKPPRRGGAIMTWTLIVGSVAAVAAFSAPMIDELGASAADNTATRLDVLEISGAMLKAVWPWGAGLGVYEALYPLHEPPGPPSKYFVNAAHNDYLQVLIELGAAGGLLVAGCLVWTGRLIWRAWAYGDPLQRAASIALGVIALHSAVDYPLRTPAIAMLAAACLAVLAKPSGGGRGDEILR